MTLGGDKTARTITDNEGRYSFNGLEAGKFFTVTPARANYSFSPGTRSLSLIGAETEAVFSATPDAIAFDNPLDTQMFFVRQQYQDFLGREGDEGGLAYWTNEIEKCGSDEGCVRARRIDVAAAFFAEDEYQRTGSFVYRLYKGALGRQVSYAEFSSDRGRVVVGPGLEQSKAALANAFVERPDFVQKYAGASTAESFADALIQTIHESSGTDLSSQRASLIAAYNSGDSMNTRRSLALREAIESNLFKQAEYNSSFVLMEYFGYLKRDPDAAGFKFWLNVLNDREPNNYRGMVCSFITSDEYQHRFSPLSTHSNRECGQ
jgi:hypothetical protein